MSAWRIAIAFLALSGANAFRMIKKSAADAKLKRIAGVPVYNYHFEGHAPKDNASALVEIKEHKNQKQSWMLVLKPNATQEQFETFCAEAMVDCTPEGHVGEDGIAFLEVIGTEQDVHDLISAHEGVVDFIEPDSPTQLIPEMPVDVEEAGASLMETDASYVWGLNKIGKSKATYTGKGVHVYVLDTGVRTTHSEFEGRAIPTLEYISRYPRECKGSIYCAKDANGHGTHCAGTVAGKTYGVAPQATIHGVKVMTDDGSGSLSWIVGAVSWITNNGYKNSVLSMSLGGRGRSAAYTKAIDTASRNGLTVVVAAGNENSDACGFSPAFVSSAITVGSTDSYNRRSSFSNYGSCLQIYAPGSAILSAGHTSDYAKETQSGTSMACPHVAGAAALLLQANPNLQSTQILSKLLSKSTSGAISSLRSGCPNKLLYVGDDRAGSAPSPPPPSPSPTPSIGYCPQVAVSSTPDRDGDCACPPGTWCSRTQSYTRNCYFSGGVGGSTGRYFLSSCTDCKCYQGR